MKLRMKETWLYQDGKEEGLKEGIEKGIESLQQTAIELCSARFGKTPDETSVQRIARFAR